MIQSLRVKPFSYAHMKYIIDLKVEVISDEPLSKVAEALFADFQYALSEGDFPTSRLSSSFAPTRNLSAPEDTTTEVCAPPVEPTSESVTDSRPAVGDDVAAVLERYNLTLPKQKKGWPEWRLPLASCYGSVYALPSMHGKLVLTNGVLAYIVCMDNVPEVRCKWAQIHLENFVPNNVESEKALPYPKPERKSKAKADPFAEFNNAPYNGF
jgi:hypothetical protein